MRTNYSFFFVSVWLVLLDLLDSLLPDSLLLDSVDEELSSELDLLVLRVPDGERLSVA